MKLIKSFLIGFITIFSLFSVNISYADELSDVLGQIFGDDTGVSTTKTPLEIAREKLQALPRGNDFIVIIDNFVEAKRSDKAYLQRISTKVKSFDLSKYHSNVDKKDETLRAVILYIDALLDDAIAKLSY